MTQATIGMVNEAGYAFRTNLNEALESLATDFSGPSAPAETYPNMIWLDTSTTPPTQRRRNTADNGWTSEISTATLTTDTILEKTSGGGVTIDGLPVKDGALQDGNVGYAATFQSVAGLRANTVTGFTSCRTNGYYSAQDGGSAFYWMDAADTTSADNGVSIIVDAAGKRWKLNCSKQGINIRQAGARCDGVTDDTAAVQAAVTAANGQRPVLIPGFCFVSATITCPTNTQIVGLSRDSCGFIRSSSHTGNTLNMGVAVPGQHAGAILVKDLWFRRIITFNGGAAYSPGVSISIDNRLTGGQVHLYTEHPQRGLIADCTFDNMPYGVVLSGGAATAIERCDFGGSIWDYAVSGLQEGHAQLWLKVGYDGFACTEIETKGNRFIGGFSSAAREVVVGSATLNFSENIGPKLGVQVDGMEGWASSNDYFGGQGDHCILFNPSSGVICSNAKITNAFLDGARQNCIHFSHSDAGGTTTLVRISNSVMNCETVGQRGLGSDSAFDAPVAYDVGMSNVKIMATLYSGIASFGIVGLDITGGSISGYNCRGGNTGDPAGSAAAYVSAPYSDKFSSVGLRVGGAVNNLSDTNNCQYGIFCGGTFAHEPVATGTVNQGLGLAGGALEVGTQGSVKVPTLANGWANFGGGYKPAGYYKDGDGIVHLQGLIASGAIGAAAFTLPAGYRPAATGNHSTVSNSALGICVVNSTGDVVPNVGNNAWFSLDGVTFKAT